MEITKGWLKTQNACPESINWLETQPETDASSLLYNLIRDAADPNCDAELQWGNWLLARKLPLREKIKYAVFAAKEMLYIFEKEHPGDSRTREAINAAENCIASKLDQGAENAALIVAKAAWRAAENGGERRRTRERAPGLHDD